jgi:hypothetical protein
MHRMLLALCALTLSIAGCVTPKVVDRPASNVDFHQFKTVRYTVHPLPNTEYGSDKEDLAYAQQTIALTDSLLSKKLESMGYSLAKEGGAADLQLDVAVTACKPGSAATRFWVGFGAGRALYEFEASFANRDGQPLGKFQGGRSYTGMEFGKSFSSRDEISTFAATRAVEQIQEFMASGASLPGQEKKK